MKKGGNHQPTACFTILFNLSLSFFSFLSPLSAIPRFVSFAWSLGFLPSRLFGFFFTPSLYMTSSHFLRLRAWWVGDLWTGHVNSPTLISRWFSALYGQRHKGKRGQHDRNALPAARGLSKHVTSCTPNRFKF